MWRSCYLLPLRKVDGITRITTESCDISDLDRIRLYIASRTIVFLSLRTRDWTHVSWLSIKLFYINGLKNWAGRVLRSLRSISRFPSYGGVVLGT